MSDYNPMTVLSAVSSFLRYHDKEDFDGVLILYRQRDGLFDAFTGGTADDPDYAEDWKDARYLLDAIFEDIGDWAEPAPPRLQLVTASHAAAAPTQPPNPVNMREVWAEQSRSLSTRVNHSGENHMDINRFKHIHPRPDDHGKMVTIHHPSAPSPLEAFDEPKQMAVIPPDGPTPEQLNGIALTQWDSVPATLTAWVHVNGQADIHEPPFLPKPGKKLSAGVVVIEPDGRFWAVAPSNAFGGYKATFPKGTIDPGMTPQATAIREAFEESGLQVEITGWIGDFERTTSVTRYYFARRIGGAPSAMGWESQAVMLVPKDKLYAVLHHANDHKLLDALLAKLASD